MDQAYYEEMTLNLHAPPHTKHRYSMGGKYHLWRYLLDSVVVKNYGVQGSHAMTQPYYDSMAQKLYYSSMSDE